MRTRALLTAGAAALLVGVLPVTAAAQETSTDPDDLEATFVPAAPGSASDDGAPEAPAPAPSDEGADAPATDSLPNTGGGLALAGGAAVAGAALLRRRS